MLHILVTGGTGTLGRQLVRQLSYQGFDVGILTTRPNVDLPSGARVFTGDLTRIETIQPVVREAAVIIHCASNPRDAHSVDVEGTRNLLAAADANRLQHLVYLSIAGIDHSPYPYYKAKLEAERMIEASALPWSILRATQFHDFVLHRLIKPFDQGDGLPLKVPKGMRFQSVDVSDVANRIQQIAMSGDLRTTITIGGPETLTIEEMGRVYFDVLGRKDKVQPDEVDGELYDVFRTGVSISTAWEMGKIGWRDFLQTLCKMGQPAIGGRPLH